MIWNLWPMSGCIYSKVVYLGRISNLIIKKINMKKLWKRKCQHPVKFCARGGLRNLLIILIIVKVYALKISRIMLCWEDGLKKLWLNRDSSMITNLTGLLKWLKIMLIIIIIREIKKKKTWLLCRIKRKILKDYKKKKKCNFCLFLFLLINLF